MHGHLGCFRLCLLWTVLFCTRGSDIFETLLSVLLGKYPEVELLGHINFLRNFRSVFHSSRAILHPISSAQGFKFLHSVTGTCFLSV